MLHVQGRQQLVDYQETKQGGPCCPGGHDDDYDVDDDYALNNGDKRYDNVHADNFDNV